LIAYQANILADTKKNKVNFYCHQFMLQKFGPNFNGYMMDGTVDYRWFCIKWQDPFFDMIREIREQILLLDMTNLH